MHPCQRNVKNSTNSQCDITAQEIGNHILTKQPQIVTGTVDSQLNLKHHPNGG